MGSSLEGDEELGAISITASISHREKATTIMT